MPELVKREDLPEGGWLEYFDNGKIQAKDGDGRFIQHPANFLPPDAARDIKQGRTKRRSTATLAEVEELLSAIPPEVLQDPRREWIVRHLAASLVTGGAGTASVARELLAQIQLPKAESVSEIGENLPKIESCWPDWGSCKYDPPAYWAIADGRFWVMKQMSVDEMLGMVARLDDMFGEEVPIPGRFREGRIDSARASGEAEIP